MNTDLITYYKERAKEYEQIYLKPERKEELSEVAAMLKYIFSDKDVFEIACGTGYWTEKIAQTATSVFATDINKMVIEIAKQKSYENANVSFAIEDIFNIQSIRQYESLFGGFIWSHIPSEDMGRFLQNINNLVSPGGTIVFIDNNYIEGTSTPIVKTDEHGNTFQLRKLENGNEYLVLKNFPTEFSIKEQLNGFAKEVKFIRWKYYWFVACTK